MIGGQMMDIVAPEHSFGAEEVITLQRDEDRRPV